MKKIKSSRKKGELKGLPLTFSHQKGEGFTLVELLVAVTIFSLITTISTGILVLSLGAQKKLLASQELSDQTSFLIEYMGRALRMAKKDDLGEIHCLTGDKVNYEITRSSQGIKFRNYKDVCQEFYKEGSLLKEEKGGVISNLTSSSLQVLNFSVFLSGETQLDNLQPKTTLFLEIEGKEGIKISTQTSISQRNPDVEK